MVHENAVIVVGLRQPQALRAAGGRINLDLGLRQQLPDHHQIHVVVIHHKDMGFRRLKALLVGFSLADP